MTFCEFQALTEHLVEALLADSEQSQFLRQATDAKTMALLVLLLTDPAQQRIAALAWAFCGPQHRRCLGGLSRIFQRVSKVLPKKATGASKSACLVRQLDRALYLITSKVH